MSRRTACAGRQYSVMLPDEMVAFVTESANIDSVSVAVRALIRKAMKEASGRFSKQLKAERPTPNA